jgi:hypothetical protein
MSVRKIVALALLALCLVVFGRWLRGLWDQDKCLDSGGSWNQAAHRCEH